MYIHYLDNNQRKINNFNLNSFIKNDFGYLINSYYIKIVIKFNYHYHYNYNYILLTKYRFQSQ